MLDDIVTPQLGLEEEPQCRDTLVDGRDADSDRCQMELIAALLEGGQIRRSSDEAENVWPVEGGHVGCLGTNLLIVMCLIMRTPAQRAHYLGGQGRLLFVKLANPSSQDSRLRCAMLFAVPLVLVPYCASVRNWSALGANAMDLGIVR